MKDKTDEIVECEMCGTKCYVRGGKHRGATNWYEPISGVLVPRVSVDKLSYFIQTWIRDKDGASQDWTYRQLAEAIVADLTAGDE